jgi:DNA-binding transcriptional MerR regulator
MAKSQSAFRTISEVATSLDTPTHVLRFWESKFAQIKPVKRAGGRRYYRPEDISLLSGIKTLLHDQGMTIKGVQKLLREQGVKHVTDLGDTHTLSETTQIAATTPDTPLRTDPGAVVVPYLAPVSGTPAASPPHATMIGLIASANKTHARTNARQIAPLVAQLEALRDRIRKTA